MAAEMRAMEINTGADRVLIAQNRISEERYVRTLARFLGTSYDTLQRLPRAAYHDTDTKLLEALKTGILRLTFGSQRLLVVAPHDVLGRHLVNNLRFRPNLAPRVCLTTSQHLFDFVHRHVSATIAKTAAFELKATRPQFSASALGSPSAVRAVIGSLVTVVALMAAPNVVITAVNIALALIFLIWLALRIVGSLTTVLLWRRRAAIAENDLPAYSVIVALYQETAAVKGLVESLKALDYPREKLDIKFVLEPDDHQTWAALTKLPLGPTFTLVAAPRDGPRTKPKALNAALPLIRGSYVAVFDAEDRPEPDQLKKAVQAFRKGSAKLACVQARLVIDNTKNSWFTRMFAAEYAALFDLFLPGIAAWRLPLPLGGSSNHFCTEILVGAGAWDPFNVTEDADLGMRLARLGYHTSIIDSATYEEAPRSFMPWLRQRTRWFKGWMQTWLVHMRNPLQLWRDLGPSGFLTFQLVIGGAILAATVHGIFAVALGWQIASDWLSTGRFGLGDGHVAKLHTTTLVVGYLISGLLAFTGLVCRRIIPCAWALVFMPIYWLLLSVAAWRALLQLITDPYKWEKTTHCLARIPDTAE